MDRGTVIMNETRQRHFHRPRAAANGGLRLEDPDCTARLGQRYRSGESVRTRADDDGFHHAALSRSLYG